MNKINAKIIQITGENIEDNAYTCLIIAPENKRIQKIFHISDGDNKDKYLFRDLDFTTYLGQTFFELYQKYNIVSQITIRDFYNDNPFTIPDIVADKLSYDNTTEFFENYNIRSELVSKDEV